MKLPAALGVVVGFAVLMLLSAGAPEDADHEYAVGELLQLAVRFTSVPTVTDEADDAGLQAGAEPEATTLVRPNAGGMLLPTAFMPQPRELLLPNDEKEKVLVADTLKEVVLLKSHPCWVGLPTQLRPTLKLVPKATDDGGEVDQEQTGTSS